MRRRRVGLNLLFLVPGETGGMETYARRLIPAIAAARPELELVAFVSADADGLFDGLVDETVVLASTARSRSRRVVAEQTRLPRAVAAHEIDLLHSLGSTAPWRSGTTSVVTLYDVIYARHPETHTLAMRWGLRVLVPVAARSADRVIAISKAAAREISEVLGVPRKRVDVVYPGGKPAGAATPEPELRSRYGLGDAPLVLSVSARRPHKNLERLLRAFANVDSRDAVLVLPGYRTPFAVELEQETERLGIAPRVRMLGWVSDSDLEGLYRAASCFVFPSLAEGFGLPVLEALERGVPVACSQASSLPEVAGDAARYFDPLDVGDIARAINDVLRDPDLAARLVAAGRVQAKRFSWEKAGRETADVYDRAWTQSRR